MLLINATRAIEALKSAGWPVWSNGYVIQVGEYQFPYVRLVCGYPMYDQRAIAQFIQE